MATRQLAVASALPSGEPLPLPVLTGVVFDMDGTLTIPNLDFAKMYKRCGVCISDDLLAEVAAMPEERSKGRNLCD